MPLNFLAFCFVYLFVLKTRSFHCVAQAGLEFTAISCLSLLECQGHRYMLPSYLALYLPKQTKTASKETNSEALKRLEIEICSFHSFLWTRGEHEARLSLLGNA